jgi:hypothetical protein
MESDRELLELAAKAAGISKERLNHPVNFWSPLTDDGDALRLAVKLGLVITPNYHVEKQGCGIIEFTEPEDSPDFCASTRRAIVRAAAEIGKSM